MLLKALIYIIQNHHLFRKRQLSIIHWNEWNKANETNCPKSPLSWLWNTYFGTFAIEERNVRCTGNSHNFGRNHEATRHGFYSMLIFPLHYSFSQAEKNLNLREGTRRETASKFSGLLSKVWAQSPCKVSGEETIEKWLLRQWIVFSENSFFEFL